MFIFGTWRHERPEARLVLAITVAVALAGTGCASSGAIPQPFPRPDGTSAGPVLRSPAPAAIPTNTGPVGDGYAIAGTALGLRGTPYRNGGNDPTGFDCSGFIWYVFGQNGIRVARTVNELFREGIEVGSGAVEPGDLLFFSTVRTGAPGASHVGMAIGGDAFVHAPSSRGEVRVERLSGPYWSTRYVGARRVR